MNRDLQKLLQEKWFLVAADFIAVLGVLCLGLDPKDGFQAFLAVCGILGASLIFVIPVLRDGGGKAERLAEQARLRAALAAEIDRLRDDARAAAPVVTSEGTALVINLMIGIGNKPFVRGSGPGLSADHGIPMNFLGIGRWQWVSPQPDAPATVEVWKNDQSPLGEPIHLSGGETVELDESHFSGA